MNLTNCSSTSLHLFLLFTLCLHFFLFMSFMTFFSHHSVLSFTHLSDLYYRLFLCLLLFLSLAFGFSFTFILLGLMQYTVYLSFIPFPPLSLCEIHSCHFRPHFLSSSDSITSISPSYLYLTSLPLSPHLPLLYSPLFSVKVFHLPFLPHVTYYMFCCLHSSSLTLSFSFVSPPYPSIFLAFQTFLLYFYLLF